MLILRRNLLTALVALAWLLIVLIGQTAGTIIYADQTMGDSTCVNLPAQANDHARAATSGNPKFCTPTPTDITVSTPSATPSNPPTNTEPPPTNTPIPTNTPTLTPSETPTVAPTSPPTFTPTDTVPPTSTPVTVPPASITVYNTGSFFVHYYVSYNLPGLPLQTLYSGVFNINQGITLTIPGTATNVGVLIQGYTGITGWQTACTRSYAQATTAVIIVSGTTFSPSCTGG